MKFNVLVTLLGLSALAVTTPACVAESVEADEGADEEATTSEADLSAYASKLVGAFQDGSGPLPRVEGLVFNPDGTFFADADTGVRCITAPCPSHVRLEGRFTATKNYVRLSPKAGMRASELHGQYRYTLSGSSLTLSRRNWSHKLKKAASYCAQANDCAAQALIHPMCVGFWTCGDTNTCAYRCGVPEVWPSDATKLVAETKGGGFRPPAPAGSTCAWGAQKYTLDVATRRLDWATCEQARDGAPLATVTGSKVLGATAFGRITRAARAMTPTLEQICGADKPFMTVEVTAGGDTKTYHDAFYACMGGGKTYVENIDGVFSAMNDAR
jgi:hypothetical protein